MLAVGLFRPPICGGSRGSPLLIWLGGVVGPVPDPLAPCSGVGGVVRPLMIYFFVLAYYILF